MAESSSRRAAVRAAQGGGRDPGALLTPRKPAMGPMLLALLFVFMSVAAGSLDGQRTRSDPACATGLRGGAAGLSACCAKSCGRCGGSNCQAHRGGRSSCCTSQIVKDNRSCAVHDPPCVIAARPPPPPTPPHPAPPAPPVPAGVHAKRGFVADGGETLPNALCCC